MSKLTLSIDPTVIARAKRYAKQQGVSVSEMVETYLDSVSRKRGHEPKRIPPVLRAVRGILKKADLNEYRRHLTSKYR